MKGQLEYFDQNDEFGALLPVTGTVSAAPPPSDSEHPWFVVELDDPLTYQGQTYRELLIASRWKGFAVDGRAPTSVFVLLVPPSATLAPGFAVRELPHVAWGMWQRVDA